jgi:acetolactate synthase I/II/III large subunit
VLIAIGMRFDDRVTSNVSKYAKQAKIIHLEIDKAEIDKIIKVDVPVKGDVKESLPLLTKMVEKREHTEWLNEFKACDQEEYRRVIEKEIHPTQEKLTMGEVIEVLNEITKGEAILVTDVGQQQMMASRYYKFKHSRGLITSGGLGTMGFGLPSAMGAQFGMPEKQVVVVMGDGGFQMTLQELGTIAQNKLPIKMIILNNNFLGMVRQWQELFFEQRYSNTEMTNPDFVKLVSAYGIAGEKVDKRAELKTAVQRLWDSKDAYLLEVKVEKKGNVFPMVPTGAATNEMVFGDEAK